MCQGTPGRHEQKSGCSKSWESGRNTVAQSFSGGSEVLVSFMDQMEMRHVERQASIPD